MAAPFRQKKLTEAEKLNIFREVAAAVSQSIELDVVLRTALDKVMEVFRVNTGGIYLYDFKTGQLTLRVSNGLTEAFVTELTEIAEGTGCAGWAFSHQQIFSAFGQPEAEYICADAQRLMGIDCLVASPIVAKNQPLGVIELFAPTSRRLTEDEATLVRLISDQIGIAVENARLYRDSRKNIAKLTDLQKELAATNRRLQAHLSKETRIAGVLQKSFLPLKLPAVEGVDIWAKIISATEAALVGGDFYDFIEFSPDYLDIVVGDVCGSGIEVATFTGLAKNTLRAFAWEANSIPKILDRANRIICTETDPSKFVALFYARLNLADRRLSYCVAGLPAPIIINRAGVISELQAGFTALGVAEEIKYKEQFHQFQPGESIFIFTDGLAEARRRDHFFGEESIKKLLAAGKDLPLDRLASKLLISAKSFSGGHLRDDVALVALRINE